MITRTRHLLFPLLAFALTLLAPSAAAVSFSLPSALSRHFYWQPKCLGNAPLVCVLRPTAGGNGASGLLRFSNIKNPQYKPFGWGWRGRRCRVRVVGTLRGLTPGKHGVHVHSFGDESVPTGTGLGPHFPNPWFTPTRHGLPWDAERHWGDFGNFVADKNGTAPVRYDDRLVTLEGIVGRGMVVHGGEDKGKMYQPSGASGPRVATCVIGFGNPQLHYKM